MSPRHRAPRAPQCDASGENRRAHKSASTPELSTYGADLFVKKQLSQISLREINSCQKVQRLVTHFLWFGFG